MARLAKCLFSHPTIDRRAGKDWGRMIAVGNVPAGLQNTGLFARGAKTGRIQNLFPAKVAYTINSLPPPPPPPALVHVYADGEQNQLSPVVWAGI